MQALEILENIVHPGSDKLDVRDQEAVSFKSACAYASTDLFQQEVHCSTCVK